MAIRIEVQSDLQIEIQRPTGHTSNFVYCQDLDGALRIIRFLIRRDLAKAEKEMFVPQCTKEANQAFRQLSKRSPYAKKD